MPRDRVPKNFGIYEPMPPGYLRQRRASIARAMRVERSIATAEIADRSSLPVVCRFGRDSSVGPVIIRKVDIVKA
jgi:hypothetical protein